MAIPSDEIPYVFRNFVLEAIDRYNRRQNISSVVVESSDHIWKNSEGEAYSYSMHVGDVRKCKSFVEPRHFTLGFADIPYGFNAPGSEFDDVSFTEQDVLDMVTDFSKVTTSKHWRFVIIHSLQQAHIVMSALEKVCNCGVEAGIWEKTNIHERPGGPRLAWAFENWSMGFYSEDGIRTMDMYHFMPEESRINIIKVPCVTKKSVNPLGFVVNPYQKPVGLGSWFVSHFSEEGDWVLDLCCGTGATLVAALLNGQNGCAVDKSAAQVDFVKSRIMTLESEWNMFEEAKEEGQGNEGHEVQPPVAGELGTIRTSTFHIETVVESENEEEKKEDSPKTPTEEDLNELLLD